MNWLGWDKEAAIRANRAVRLSALGATSLSAGLTGLIINHGFTMFSGIALGISAVFLYLDLRIFSEHDGVQVFTKVYWVGRPYPLTVRWFLFLAMAVLVSLSIFNVIIFYRDGAQRKQWLIEGDRADGIVVSQRGTGGSSGCMAVVEYENQAARLSKSFTIQGSQCPRITRGNSLALVFPHGAPDKAIPIEFDLQRGLKIEIAWWLLLSIVIYPGWYLIKRPLVNLLRNTTN